MNSSKMMYFQLIQKSTEAFIEHVFPEVANGKERVDYQVEGEFGTNVVRIFLTRFIDSTVHDNFLKALRKIGHCSLTYDVIDKKATSSPPPKSSQVVQKTGNKLLEALAVLQKYLFAADYAFRNGYIYIRPDEAR